jgi:hypothetical protein
VCAERYLLYVIWEHQHLVISGSHFELGEELCASQFIKQLHHRNWEFVLNRGVIECAIVHAKSPRAVSLSNEERRRGKG